MGVWKNHVTPVGRLQTFRPGIPLSRTRRVSVSLMAGEPVRFDDLAPDEMIVFLNEARQHAEVDPTSRDEYSGFDDLAETWGCTKCGGEHALEDTLVVDGVPQCPSCGARGWEDVVPKPKAT